MTTTPKTLTTLEVDKFLASLVCNQSSKVKAKKGIRNYLIALLMLDAGLRVGEVVTLRVCNLFFASVPVQSIHVKK